MARGAISTIVSSRGHAGRMSRKESTVMLSQKDKGERFRALHTQDSAFIIPNPWDVGSARLLAGLGFPALASTSSGFARSVGIRDYQPGRKRVLAPVAEVGAAVGV